MSRIGFHTYSSDNSQVIQLRGRLGGILNLLTGMFGGGNNMVAKADLAVEKLQTYKERMVR